MMSMNRQMKLPEIQKIMQEFEKQSEIMDMKEEMMNDVIGKIDKYKTGVMVLSWFYPVRGREMFAILSF